MKKACLQINVWSDDDVLPDDCSDLAELLEPHLEHVAKACSEGYQAGEIIGDGFKGWWSLTPEKNVSL